MILLVLHVAYNVGPVKSAPKMAVFCGKGVLNCVIWLFGANIGRRALIDCREVKNVVIQPRQLDVHSRVDTVLGELWWHYACWRNCHNYWLRGVSMVRWLKLNRDWWRYRCVSSCDSWAPVSVHTTARLAFSVYVTIHCSCHTDGVTRDRLLCHRRS